TIHVTDLFENAPPSFQSDGNLTVSENTTFVYEFNATDPDGDILTYSILHGPDASLFDLNQSSGALTFISPKDFEAPEDSNTDNIYELFIQVGDADSNLTLQTFVQVTDLLESNPNNTPQFQSDGNLTVTENTTFVYEFNATDSDGDPLTYSILYGEDQQFFEINFSTGALSFISPKDFENPEDKDLDNIYHLTIEVMDGESSVALNLFVLVTDISEPDFDSFGTLQIEENRPVGSLVGQFNAINIEPNQPFSYSVLSFDENPFQIQDRIMELEVLAQDVSKSQQEIDSYQIEIIELQGRIELVKSNGLFFVDQNGSLRTSQTLDYDAFSEHPYFTILVQATDEHNFTVTKQFMVDLLEVELEPENTLPAIVRTIGSADNSETSYLLQGEILADGGSAIVETGFWVSKSIRFSDPIRLTALIDPLTGEFHSEFVEFEPGTRYYFRSYVVNHYGESKGSIKKFKTPEIIDPSAWWKDTTDVGGGWRNSDWFGTFLIYPSLNWIFHSKLGWVYTVNDGSKGIWVWHSQHGWLWTQKGVWPFLYSNNSSNWIYFMKNINGQAVFYDYETKSYLLDIGVVPNI
ncbi:MAG: cadherin repeat domain-containing protein, partial [Opitutales bacterium]|nr:cadherin repeat domain-containing protein [Opitutales bacterium]